MLKERNLMWNCERGQTNPQKSLKLYHLKNISRVRTFLSQASTETRLHTFITHRMDYCNTLLSRFPKKSISYLLLQNSAAQMMTKTTWRAHITLILQYFYWLPVTFKTDFKVILLVYKTLVYISIGSTYLSDFLLFYKSARTLRSYGKKWVRTKSLGEGFPINGPCLWSSLLEDLELKPNTKPNFFPWLSFDYKFSYFSIYLWIYIF